MSSACHFILKPAHSCFFLSQMEMGQWDNGLLERERAREKEQISLSLSNMYLDDALLHPSDSTSGVHFPLSDTLTHTCISYIRICITVRI